MHPMHPSILPIRRPRQNDGCGTIPKRVHALCRATQRPLLEEEGGVKMFDARTAIPVLVLAGTERELFADQSNQLFFACKSQQPKAKLHLHAKRQISPHGKPTNQQPTQKRHPCAARPIWW